MKGGCTNNNCSNDGDRVCDTPPDATGNPNSTCSGTEDSCPADAVNDLVNNYMDYGDITCQNTFTPGQINRMVNTLNTVRAGLCGSIGTLNLCPKPVLSFNTIIDNATASNQARVFPNLQLVGSSTNKSGFNYEVDFGDGSGTTLYDATLYSTTVPFTHTYVTNQTYTISIALKYRASPTSAFLPECTQKITKYFKSKCPFLAPTFAASKTTVIPNESVVFTNTTTCPVTGQCSFNWLKDAQVFSTDPLTASNVIASTNSVSQIQLQMTYNGCTSKSNGQAIQVGINQCVEDKRYSKFIWNGNNLSTYENNELIIQNIFPGSHMNEAGGLICDRYTGAVLLSSNGRSIYGRDNQMIQGGRNIFFERNSSTQSDIILQHPLQSNIYYIFSTSIMNAPFHTFDTALQYVTVDINGGTNGAVIAGPTNLLSRSPEKMVVTSKVDGSGYFVISHEIGTSKFITYEINLNGVSSTPVYSNVGGQSIIVDYDQTDSDTRHDMAGGMMINQQGTQLAITYGYQRKIELFNYNKLTGTVGSLIATINTGHIIRPYYVQFSPDGSKLYASNGAFPADAWHQYDLQASNIENSKIRVSGIGGTVSEVGQMLIVDGRFILNSQNKLYEITIPNATAANNACGVTLVTQQTLVRDDVYGMSHAPIDLTEKATYTMSGPACVKPGVKVNVYSLNVPVNPLNTYKWKIIQGIPPLASIAGSSTGSSVTLDFSSQGGTVELQCEVNSVCGSSLIKKTITIDNTCPGPVCAIQITVANNEPTVLIPTCHPSVTLNASNGFVTYKWYKDDTEILGATNSTLVISQVPGQSQGGNYKVTGINVQTCEATSTAITVIDQLTISGNNEICPDQKASLNLNIAGVTGLQPNWVQWFQNASTTPTASPSGTAGTYYALVVLPTYAACTLRTADYPVTVLPAPNPYIITSVGELNRCSSDPGSVVLTGTPPIVQPHFIASYVWSSGQPNVSSITTNVAGSYSITAMGTNGCSSISNTVVILAPAVVIRESCYGNGTTSLTASQNIGGNNYVWKNSAGTVVGNTATINVPSTSNVYLLE